MIAQRIALLLTLAPLTAPAVAEDDNDGLDRFSEGGVSYAQLERGVRRVRVTSALPGTSYRGSVTVPDSVTWKGTSYAVVAVEANAFGGCTALRSVALPQGVREIGLGAFANCPNLTEVTLPDSLRALPPSCFSKCLRLVSVKLPAALKRIGKSAFQDCRSLESIALPKSLESIDKKAFATCPKLAKIAMYNGTQFASNSFDPLVTIQMRAR